jgi:hypothetical protein
MSTLLERGFADVWERTIQPELADLAPKFSIVAAKKAK